MISTLTDPAMVPGDPPRRYANADGYVRLRWLIAPNEWLECYEHRFVAGLPPTHLDVHHVNRIRDDNRRENLMILTREDHARLHQKENADEYAARRASRGGFRSQVAYEKAQRRIAQELELAQRSLRMRAAYEAGATTTEVGARFGIDASRVSVHLRRIGTVMRPFRRYRH